MRSIKLFCAILFSLSVTACGGGGGGGSIGPAPAPGSEGTAGAPVTITMPHNGQVDGSNDSFYAYSATGNIQTITATNLTDDIDLKVYTDATFTTQSSNWTCTSSWGTTADSCTAITPVPAGTVLYISAWEYTTAGASYTLGVTTTSTGTVSEGTAGAPLTITMPYNGHVDSVNDSFYAYSATGTIQTITATNLTGNVDLKVYTDSTFTTLSSNWTCSTNLGTAADSCTAITPVSAGTVLYISAWNNTTAGATYTLGVTTTSTVTSSEGAAGAPLTITMPHNGQVDSVNDSYYAYIATGTIQTITVSNLTTDVDPIVYTDSSFTTPSSNWTCTASFGTATDSCTASIAAAPGTVLYIRAAGYLSTGGTYTLGVTTTSTVTVSEGVAGTPLAISMPHNGQVTGAAGWYADSFYSYIATGTIQTITATNLTDDIDLNVYTDSTFTTLSSNWSCPLKLGTIAETCTTPTPVPAGTVLYIRAWNYTIAGGTYTLSVAP